MDWYTQIRKMKRNTYKIGLNNLENSFINLTLQVETLYKVNLLS